MKVNGLGPEQCCHLNSVISYWMISIQLDHGNHGYDITYDQQEAAVFLPMTARAAIDG